MTEITPTAVLNGIADTLVVEARFSSKEEALRSLARSAVRQRMLRYRRRIQRLERKHGTDFAGFTERLAGSATPSKRMTGSPGAQPSKCWTSGRQPIRVCRHESART